MKYSIFTPLLLSGLLLLGTRVSAENQPAPSIEELWRIIQTQQAEIETLKQQQAETEQKATAADTKAEAAVVAVEESASGASGSGSWADKTTIGGYGELHYNNIDADDSQYDHDEIDFHRFVLYFGHEFSDSIRFFSEFEIEHGGVESDPGPLDGEVEVEQAYIEFDLQENLQARGGVFLLPVGIINETHEPTTFYGVERNDVENIIIPASWWAGGAAIGGHFDNGISWDLAVTEGLMMETSGSSAFRVRSGRQKTSQADASDLAYTGRIKYTGIPGLELAASINYQTDASQAGGDGLGKGILYETHAVYQNGPFGLRALYAEWDFDGSLVKAAGADDQSGWYIEPSIKPWEKLGLYARYEDLDGYRDADRFNQWEIGANFWPHEDVVLKADFRSRDHDRSSASGRDFDAFDLGIGYQF